MAKSQTGAQASSTTGRARTVIYVHGIGNKPIASTLKCQWDTALFGHTVGERSRLAYWVDRSRHPTPEDATCGSPDVVSIDPEDTRPASVRRLSNSRSGWIDEITAASGASDEAAACMARIAKQMDAAPGGAAKASGPRKQAFGFLGDRVQRWITRGLTRAFLGDVHDFLFDEDRRRLMRDALLERLRAGGGPFVIVAHSQGTMIAYDVLRELGKEVDVPLFVTLGSPLGLDEVRDRLKLFAGTKKLFRPTGVGHWINVADRLDPVAADPTLANEYLLPTGKQVPKLVDRNGLSLNPDSPRHPHSATGYLSLSQVRTAVRDAVIPAFRQQVASFVVARDLVRDLEDEGDQTRHAVLIELDDPAGAESLDGIRARIHAALAGLLGDRIEDAEIDDLQRFVSASLTRFEIERLSAEHKGLRLRRVWRNAVKRKLISTSSRTVQALPAHRGYEARGRDIGWAVLDTGIHAKHGHFKQHDNVKVSWDCTGRGKPKPGGDDKDGHGTHVGGIIAGVATVKDAEGREVLMTGMAPECKLHTYKVLGDDGSGRDSWVIKALDDVAEVNEKAGKLVIHGVNLSLGSSFDPGVFGCGHTPLCRELRRLHGQGVVVVVAAGNEGYAILESEDGPLEANMDLTIGDPANLEEAIAVGSVHKANPHTYGISYFSSRGPTADGRVKPDVVAPGERILSARHDPARSKTVEGWYVEMDGTSMAAPHVSGLLAAFLSVHSEFIGRPDDVKRILIDNCTDLKRDPYFQGAGLPNLTRMLLNT